MAAKKPKKRAENYNEKVRVKGSFDELMGALFPKVGVSKKEKNKKPKK